MRQLGAFVAVMVLLMIGTCALIGFRDANEVSADYGVAAVPRRGARRIVSLVGWAVYAILVAEVLWVALRVLGPSGDG